MKNWNKIKNCLKTNRYLHLSMLIFLFFIITTIYYPYLSTADYFDHSSAVKELSMHPLNPIDPQLMIEGMQSPRYTPYTFILGMFSRITGLDVFATMKIAGLVNLVLFLTSFYLLMSRLFNSKKMPFYGLIMLLFFWGFGWNITSGYNLKLLVFVLPYPSFLSFSLSFLGMYLVIRYLDEKNYLFYLLFMAIGSFIFLAHFPTFTFLALSSFLLAFFCSYRDFRSSILSFVPFTQKFDLGRFLVLIMPVIASLISFLWPYYSFYNLMMLVKDNEVLSLPLGIAKIFVITGPLLIVGLPIWYSYRRNLKSGYMRYLWAAFLITFLIFICYYFYPLPYSERYLFYMAFYLQLVMAFKYKELGILSFRQWANGRRSSLKYALAAILFLCITFQIALVGSFYMKFCTGQIADRVDLEEYNKFRQKIGPYEIFISDQHTSHVMPTFSGRAVGHFGAHLNEFVPDFRERTAALDTFFNISTPDTVRRQILEKYTVSSILINFKYADREIYGLLKGYGQTVYQDRNFVIIKVSKNEN